MGIQGQNVKAMSSLVKWGVGPRPPNLEKSWATWLSPPPPARACLSAFPLVTTDIGHCKQHSTAQNACRQGQGSGMKTDSLLQKGEMKLAPHSVIAHLSPKIKNSGPPFVPIPLADFLTRFWVIGEMGSSLT